MRKFLSLLCLLLCLACVMGMAIACTDTEDTPDDVPPEQPDVEPTPEPEPEVIGFADSTVRVVRGDQYTVENITTKAAMKLREGLMNAAVAKVDIVTDYEADTDDILELVVGKTNRTIGTQLDLALEKNQFFIYYDGKDILLTSNTEYGVEKAVEYFISSYLKDGECAVPVALDYIGSFELPPDVYIINDIRYIGQPTGDEDWNDTVRLYTALQGRLNKDAKENGFFVYQIDANDPYNSTNDRFWLEYIMGEGKMLEGSTLIELNTWQELWDALGSYVKSAGIVVWDPDVPSTSNVAATICSVEGYLPVRYDTDADSMYTWLTSNGVEVKFDLCNMFTGEKGTKIADTDIDSTGSIKCDPYLWALEKYMDRCNPEMLAYALDGASAVASNPVAQKSTVGIGPAANQLYSHDYYIYNECFFIDLTCVADEKPCDDPDQPMGTDAKTLSTILSTMEERNNGKFSKLMGFPPWYMKYTVFNNNGKTPEVGLEWAFVAFITKYNFIKEADAWNPSWMTNASVYCQYEMTTEKFENNKSPVEEVFDKSIRYFSLYIGDYDSSAWLKLMVPDCFKPNDQRGEIPLMWAFNPNLADRVPMIFDYVYENKTELDYFTTGDTGAGYVFPNKLKDLNMWIEYNEPYMDKFDMDIVGFIIDNEGLRKDVLEAYTEITPYGAFTNVGTYANDYLTVMDEEWVFLREMDIYPNDSEDWMPEMVNQFTRYGKYNFAGFRCIRQYTPRIVDSVNRFVEWANARNDGYEYMYVDTYTLFDLILQSGQGEWVYSWD